MDYALTQLIIDVIQSSVILFIAWDIFLLKCNKVNKPEKDML